MSIMTFDLTISAILSVKLGLTKQYNHVFNIIENVKDESMNKVIIFKLISFLE